MEKKQDRRVRKSKDSLKNSLIELMQSKSVNNITVKELVIKADLNRSTFYNYYCDIPDMLKKLEEELYTEFLYTIERHIYKCDKNIDISEKVSLFLQAIKSCIRLSNNAFCLSSRVITIGFFVSVK